MSDRPPARPISDTELGYIEGVLRTGHQEFKIKRTSILGLLARLRAAEEESKGRNAYIDQLENDFFELTRIGSQALARELHPETGAEVATNLVNEIDELRARLCAAEERAKELAAWRDEAVASCAKRQCALRDERIAELERQLAEANQRLAELKIDSTAPRMQFCGQQFTDGSLTFNCAREPGRTGDCA